jgi:hypothetical protein
MLTWNVKYFDINANVIRDYNVLRQRDDFIKKLKKQCANKAEFSEALKHEFMWRYWSRSEYELIIEVFGNRVVLSPWCGCREPACVAVDVTDDPNFDWLGFADFYIDKQIYRDKAKIDIYNQLEWRWNELVDYCWYTRLPYERKHEKFNKEV